MIGAVLNAFAQIHLIGFADAMLEGRTLSQHTGLDFFGLDTEDGRATALRIMRKHVEEQSHQTLTLRTFEPAEDAFVGISGLFLALCHYDTSEGAVAKLEPCTRIVLAGNAGGVVLSFPFPLTTGHLTGAYTGGGSGTDGHATLEVAEYLGGLQHRLFEHLKGKNEPLRVEFDLMCTLASFTPERTLSLEQIAAFCFRAGTTLMTISGN